MNTNPFDPMLEVFNVRTGEVVLRTTWEASAIAHANIQSVPHDVRPTTAMVKAGVLGFTAS